MTKKKIKVGDSVKVKYEGKLVYGSITNVDNFSEKTLYEVTMEGGVKEYAYYWEEEFLDHFEEVQIFVNPDKNEALF